MVNNIAIAETAGTVFSVMLVGTIVIGFHKENKKNDACILSQFGDHSVRWQFQ